MLRRVANARGQGERHTQRLACFVRMSQALPSCSISSIKAPTRTVTEGDGVRGRMASSNAGIAHILCRTPTPLDLAGCCRYASIACMLYQCTPCSNTHHMNDLCCRWGFWKKLAPSSKDQQHLLPDGHSPSSPTSQHTLVIQVIHPITDTGVTMGML